MLFNFGTKLVLLENIYKYCTIVCVNAEVFVLLLHKNNNTTMKKLLFTGLLLLASVMIQAQEVIYLTTDQFNEKVVNVRQETWDYKGTKPCVIDFYASWCGPCKRLAPIMEELAKQYKGKVVFYKVDTDKEPLLAQAFGIRSIPQILFVPMQGKPQMAQGLLPKETLQQAIEDVLLK